ncbi:MAG TPA: response regulator transcription factor [Candidatus Binataceae bacterium]|nr:response regulator transcription factor [Candidatus Binataceae bacterium]
MAVAKQKVVRVVIADDHPLVREALKSLLDRSPNIEVVAQVARADELTGTLAAVACDVLLLDLKMDRWVIDDIASLATLTRVVVFTGSDRTEDVVAAFRMGARGIVQKTAPVETLVDAIAAVAAGMVWIPSEVQQKLNTQWDGGGNEQLTRRESEIVRYVAMGLRNSEVAQRLAIAEGTVKVHLNNIFQKLNIRDRVQLTLYALARGLITLSDQRP